MLIFEESSKGRWAKAQARENFVKVAFPKLLCRQDIPLLPEVSELQVVRHYTRLSQKNFSIDTHFYPLGSCTMKYNPRGAHKAAMMPGFLGRHPLTPDSHQQGVMACLYDLQEILKDITGFEGMALSPMAGAQGEFAGVAMIKAYHHFHQDNARVEMLVPDAAHGTNPASAAMCGYTVKEIPTNEAGDVDLEALQAMLGPQTAGIMLTNPSTLGVFERNIQEISRRVHAVGGLLYYDGANLNAILGQARPGDMGFDVMHMNLHKTFATPHGGGGPGAGPIAYHAKLAPFAPIPRVAQDPHGQYRWLTHADCPQSIGRLSAFSGNMGVLLRAYAYIRILGQAGLKAVGEFATLNANYLMARLSQIGFTVAMPGRMATHEFIITLSHEKKTYQVSAMDVAKRLLDFGFHAPTTYFPLLIPECLLIEPTETEAKETLDQFVDAMQSILQEIKTNPDLVRSAPHTLPARRLDDVRAVKMLDVVFKPERH